MFDETLSLTNLDPMDILELDVPAHRGLVNRHLLTTSSIIRKDFNPSRRIMKITNDYLGANMRGTDLKGYNFRGALLIAADLSGADLRKADFIGADLRDANLSDANLTGSFF
ncbi:pentapeptide repeat-containing protein [Paenibacillus herberti]|uniref:pentapeptide repeat-containing protein n=1 Tax=Paenibacillus herberti TaxID=1619309 RepID=UPI001FE25F92|nr:pentapeptide repeat-containing protein [Paenibacillus herberti]